VKLRCEREALDDWWHKVALHYQGGTGPERGTVCELFK
jgi:hypothetical protein